MQKRRRKMEYVTIGSRKLPLTMFFRVMQYVSLKVALDEMKRRGKIIEKPKPLNDYEWEDEYYKNKENCIKKAEEYLLRAGIVDIRAFQRRLSKERLYGLWHMEIEMWFEDAIEDLLDMYRYYGDFFKALRKFFGIDKERRQSPIEIAIKSMPDDYNVSSAVKRYERIKEEYKKYQKLKEWILWRVRWLKIPRGRGTEINQLLAFQDLINNIKEILTKKGYEPSPENIQLALWMLWRARLSLPEPFASLLRKTAKNINNLRQVLEMIDEE